MEIICKQCGKKFKTYKKDGKYCSPKCSGLSKVKREVRKCSICGKEFMVVPCSKKKFCSKECVCINASSSGNKKEVICLMCGKKFFVYGIRKSIAKYCSKKCYFSSMNIEAKKYECKECGKMFSYGKGYKNSKMLCSNQCYEKMLQKRWKNAKKLALRRDNYTCQACGIRRKRFKNIKSTNMIVCHLNGSSNELSNLICLCRSCYMKRNAKRNVNITGEMTKLRNEEIVKLYKNGLSQISISKRFNISRQRINQIIKKSILPIDKKNKIDIIE